LEAVATVKYLSWLKFTFKNNFRNGSNRCCNGESTAPFETNATAKYLLLVIFLLQKQLSQRLQPPLQR
jgi:hypothetical protein